MNTESTIETIKNMSREYYALLKTKPLEIILITLSIPVCLIMWATARTVRKALGDI